MFESLRSQHTHKILRDNWKLPIDCFCTASKNLTANSCLRSTLISQSSLTPRVYQELDLVWLLILTRVLALWYLLPCFARLILPVKASVNATDMVLAAQGRARFGRSTLAKLLTVLDKEGVVV